MSPFPRIYRIFVTPFCTSWCHVLWQQFSDWILVYINYSLSVWYLYFLMSCSTTFCLDSCIHKLRFVVQSVNSWAWLQWRPLSKWRNLISLKNQKIETMQYPSRLEIIWSLRRRRIKTDNHVGVSTLIRVTWSRIDVVSSHPATSVVASLLTQ
jgi:hypothetical protein